MQVRGFLADQRLNLLIPGDSERFRHRRLFEMLYHSMEEYLSSILTNESQNGPKPFTNVEKVHFVPHGEVFARKFKNFLARILSGEKK